jgi:DNA polymerase III delta prime subunit
MEVEKELNFNVIELISSIAKVVRNSELSDEVLEKVSQQCETLAEYLDVNKQQAMLFSVIFVLYSKLPSVNIRELYSFFNIDFIEGLKFKYDIQVLLNKELIELEEFYSKQRRKTNLTRSSLIIPESIISATYRNVEIPQKITFELDIYEFCDTVTTYINERCEDKIDTNSLFKYVKELEDANPEIEGVENLLKLGLLIEDRVLVYQILNDMVSTGRYTLIESTLKDMYDNARLRMNKYRELLFNENPMYEMDLIQLHRQKFSNDAQLELTAYGMEFLLGDDAILYQVKNKNKDILSYQDIKQVELFFDGKLKQQIDFLSNSLKHENFVLLQRRLSEKNMSSGICSILHGSPGTGKTELCYQLAKLTGRDIFLLDLSQMKDLYFGQSEKNTKDVFTRYNFLLSKNEVAPILLINECDGLFSRRLTNTQRSTDQTINTIQNILLEELEKFQGILLCTSNLVENLDSAFERRFLFKIEFQKPSIEVKLKIWKSKLNWIDDDFAKELAEQFDLSGGQIDNVVRKVIMQEVLNGKLPSNDEINEFCKTETILKKTMNKIGYK